MEIHGRTRCNKPSESVQLLTAGSSCTALLKIGTITGLFQGSCDNGSRSALPFCLIADQRTRFRLRPRARPHKPTPTLRPLAQALRSTACFEAWRAGWRPAPLAGLRPPRSPRYRFRLHHRAPAALSADLLAERAPESAKQRGQPPHRLGPRSPTRLRGSARYLPPRIDKHLN